MVRGGRGLDRRRAANAPASGPDGLEVHAGRTRAFGIGGICADESAVLLPALKAVAVADGVIRRGKGPLAFVPDEYMVDDPEDAPRVKRALKKAYRKLAEARWDHLLMAHGAPW